jgi:hypothetical protein
VILTSLYVLGPVAALTIAFLLYVVERGPVVLLRWLRLIDELKARHRHKREDRRDAG